MEIGKRKKKLNEYYSSYSFTSEDAHTICLGEISLIHFFFKYILGHNILSEYRELNINHVKLEEWGMLTRRRRRGPRKNWMKKTSIDRDYSKTKDQEYDF